MADNKKSVIVYVDWGTTFDKLNEEEAGRLIKHFFDYVRDKNPEPPDRITEIAFEPIKQQLKRDLNKYRAETIKNTISGQMGSLKRWHPELYLQVFNGEMELEEAVKIANRSKGMPPDESYSPPIIPHTPPNSSIAKIADTDNVNDTVNDTDTVKINFISISGQKILKKASEVAKNELKQRYEQTLLTTLKGIDEKKLLLEFDKKYPQHEFENRNHFFDCLKKTGKEILNPKQNGHKSETTSTPYREKI